MQLIKNPNQRETNADALMSLAHIKLRIPISKLKEQGNEAKCQIGNLSSTPAILFLAISTYFSSFSIKK